MNNLYVDKRGKVETLKHWEDAYESFWSVFETPLTDKHLKLSLPKRPTDAWERFVNVIGLTKYEG